MDDRVYSGLVEYLVNRVMFKIMDEQIDGVSSYKTDNYEEEILVTLSIGGSRTTISFPVIEVLPYDNAEQYLEGLVNEVAPRIRAKIYALKTKLKGR